MKSRKPWTGEHAEPAHIRQYRKEAMKVLNRISSKYGKDGLRNA